MDTDISNDDIITDFLRINSNKTHYEDVYESEMVKELIKIYQIEYNKIKKSIFENEEKVKGQIDLFRNMEYCINDSTEYKSIDESSLKMQYLYSNQLAAIVTNGDGNCLFYALIITLFGERDNKTMIELSQMLRRCCVYMLLIHEESISQLHYRVKNPRKAQSNYRYKVLAYHHIIYKAFTNYHFNGEHARIALSYVIQKPIATIMLNCSLPNITCNNPTNSNSNNVYIFFEKNHYIASNSKNNTAAENIKITLFDNCDKCKEEINNKPFMDVNSPISLDSPVKSTIDFRQPLSVVDHNILSPKILDIYALDSNEISIASILNEKVNLKRKHETLFEPIKVKKLTNINGHTGSIKSCLQVIGEKRFTDIYRNFFLVENSTMELIFVFKKNKLKISANCQDSILNFSKHQFAKESLAASLLFFIESKNKSHIYDENLAQFRKQSGVSVEAMSESLKQTNIQIANETRQKSEIPIDLKVLFDGVLTHASIMFSVQLKLPVIAYPRKFLQILRDLKDFGLNFKLLEFNKSVTTLRENTRVYCNFGSNEDNSDFIFVYKNLKLIQYTNLIKEREIWKEKNPILFDEIEKIYSIANNDEELENDDEFFKTEKIRWPLEKIVARGCVDKVGVFYKTIFIRWNNIQFPDTWTHEFDLDASQLVRELEDTLTVKRKMLDFVYTVSNLVDESDEQAEKYILKDLDSLKRGNC
jgi:hypothetical protein